VSYYVLKNKYTLPGFLFKAVASWVIVLAGVTIILLVDWGISGTTHFQLLKSLPGPLMTLLDLCGAYAGIGAICLYVTMWVYWIAVERSPILTRITWLLALVFGLPFGALIYALVVWRRGVTKVNGPQPLHNVSVRG
jgi:hypothetical protein